MLTALAYSHVLLDHLIQIFPQGHFIDATLGKGHDTLYLVNHPQFMGLVSAFDIQEQALQITREKLGKKANCVTLYHTSHHTIETCLTHVPVFHGAIFNLGYLPGSNHHLTTRYETTYAAIRQIADKLVIGGQIILVVYSGHPQGQNEKDHLLQELSRWPQDTFQVLTYQFINQANHPPMTMVIERIHPPKRS